MAFHDEILFNILINSDNIENISQINKNIYTICNSVYFWQEKFKHDNLLILTKESPTSINNWMKEYQYVFNAYREADHIYTINNIEATRKIDQTNGEIILTMPRSINPRLILPEYTAYFVHTSLAAKDLIPFNHHITLTRIDNHHYQFQYIIKSYLGIMTSQKINCTKKDIIDILIHVLYHNNYSQYIHIWDSEKQPFTEDLLFLYDLNKIANKRIGILDTLNYIK